MFPNKLLWYTNYSAGMNVTMLLFWSFVWVLTTRESWHFIKVVLETIFFVLSQTWEVHGWAQATSVKQSSAGTANVPNTMAGNGRTEALHPHRHKEEHHDSQTLDSKLVPTQADTPLPPGSLWDMGCPGIQDLWHLPRVHSW